MNIDIIKTPPACEVRCTGKITFADYISFKDVLAVTEDPVITSIRLDLAGVDFIDSAGLGMLVIFHNAVAKSRQQAVISGVKGQVEKLLKLSRMDTMFRISNSPTG